MGVYTMATLSMLQKQRRVILEALRLAPLKVCIPRFSQLLHNCPDSWRQWSPKPFAEVGLIIQTWHSHYAFEYAYFLFVFITCLFHIP